MDHAPSLESVAEAFRLWRQTRTRKGRTPAPLRAQAVALLAHHSRCQVSRALGITTTTLSNWRKQAPASQGRASLVNTFVELPLTPSAHPLPEPAAITVTVHDHCGRMTITGALSPAHLAALVREGRGLS